jgi:hypothetical protein
VERRSADDPAARAAAVAGFDDGQGCTHVIPGHRVEFSFPFLHSKIFN